MQLDKSSTTLYRTDRGDRMNMETDNYAQVLLDRDKYSFEQLVKTLLADLTHDNRVNLESGLWLLNKTTGQESRVKRLRKQIMKGLAINNG
jgi:riboflavin synthase alpha subunit